MKLQDDILTTENDTLNTTEDLSSWTLPLGEDLTEKVWTPIEYLDFEEIEWDDLVYDRVEKAEAKRIKTLLHEMLLRMLKPIGEVKKLMQLLFSHISLLFGLCSSKTSLIINGYFSHLLSRIPSF